MVGWHHLLNGHEFEQALEVGDGQGSLASCSPWGHKESDTTEWLKWTISSSATPFSFSQSFPESGSFPVSWLFTSGDFSFNISPSNEHSGLISFRIDWFDLFLSKGLSRVFQHHSLKASILQLMAPHSSTLAWKIPWAEEPGRLPSMGSLRVGHDWATSLSLSCIGGENGNPLQCSCLENPRDGGAWWAAVYGVAQSRTQLKDLAATYVHISSSSSIHPLMDIWVVSVSWLLWIVLLWTQGYMHLFEL